EIVSTKHLVVDGSNIATEGRDRPSLRQLDEAVRAFLEEQPVDQFTVVVDATFGHRIPKDEVEEYEAAIDAGEIITPPAGAIGRGDAFVLEIAERTGAVILSNDSFQEFHGEHPWLFEEGRLIGGKPVPHVGWVFLPRSPVRGAKSRIAVKEQRRKVAGRAAESTGSRRGGRRGRREDAGATTSGDRAASDARSSGTRSSGTRSSDTRSGRRSKPATPAPDQYLNDALPFIEFVGA